MCSIPVSAWLSYLLVVINGKVRSPARFIMQECKKLTEVQLIAFADETKQSGYTFAIFLVAEEKVAAVRKALKAQKRPSQAAIHFSKETNQTRQSFVRLLQKLECEIIIYTTKK